MSAIRPTESSAWARIINTGIAVGAFAATAAATLSLVYLCTPVQAIEPTSSSLSNSGAIEVVANAAIVIPNMLGLVAVNVHVFNRDRPRPPLALPSSEQILELEEFQNCENALEESLETLSRSEAPPCSVEERSVALQIPNDREFDIDHVVYRVLADTLDIVRVSPNNLQRSEHLFRERAKKEGIDEESLSIKIDADCLPVAKIVARAIYQNERGSGFTYGKISSKITGHTGIGNCGEMAHVAFFKALETTGPDMWKLRIDVVRIKNGDHMFLVFGRALDSDPCDYRTWGENTRVLDVWNQEIYLLKDVDTRLYDYLGVDWETGSPILMPFDPETQNLEVYYGNLCSLRDLGDAVNSLPLNQRQKELIVDVARQLSLFHQEEALESKLDFANTLHELCDHPEIESISVIQLLRDQMRHFIELSHSHYKC